MFAARFNSICINCDSRISKGDMIEMTDEGAIHFDCKEQTRIRNWLATVCEKCNLTKPCECG